MPKNVKCKNCNRLKNHWCEAVLDSPDEDMDRDCRHFWQKTNGDRIRSMTDEELANFLAQKFTDYSADKMCEKGETPTATYLYLERETWFRAWMQWFRQPAEVDMENKRRLMVNLEDIVDLDAQTKANNEAIRKAIAFMVGGAEDGN